MGTVRPTGVFWPVDCRRMALPACSVKQAALCRPVAWTHRTSSGAEEPGAAETGGPGSWPGCLCPCPLGRNHPWIPAAPTCCCSCLLALPRPADCGASRRTPDLLGTSSLRPSIGGVAARPEPPSSGHPVESCRCPQESPSSWRTRRRRVMACCRTGHAATC